MKRIVKRALLGLVGVIVVVAAGAGIYACVQASKFDAAVAKTYDIKPLDNIKASTDPAVIERGKHLAAAVAPCSTKQCHGPDLGGGDKLVLGPLGELDAPNISMGGAGAAYTDGELARLLRHGIKKDGKTLLFMPAQDFSCWMPDDDLTAIVSYVRSLPPVDRPNGVVRVGVVGKILDQRGEFAMNVAAHINHDKPDLAPPPSPTPTYGKYLAMACTGCHGDHFSGGKIPGTPPDFPPPLNLTPDKTGLTGWTYEDFDKLLTTSIRKNGEKLKPFMPVEAFGKMNDVEKHALFAYLQTLPPTPYGNR